MRHLQLLLATASLTGCLVGTGSPSTPTGSGDDDVSGGHELLPPGKLAVVLAHGFGGTGESFDPAIVAAIEADGHAVLRAEVPGVEGVAQRAVALGPQIDAFLVATGATQAHLIAHSMGGLDARHLISTLGFAPKVASLTTMSTPHRGTPLADVALGVRAGNQQEALDAIIELVGQVDPAALDRALVDLSEANAATFNAANLDAATVKYQSYAGFSTPNAIANPNADAACAGAPTPAPDQMRAVLVLPATIVANGTDRKPNDGVVGVASSLWTGFKGCIAADHLDETTTPSAGQLGLDTPAFYKALVAELAL
jgi:triacylglycerol lipase